MNLDLLGQITGLAGFIILTGFAIYKYTKQNKEFGAKK